MVRNASNIIRQIGASISLQSSVLGAILFSIFMNDITLDDKLKNYVRIYFSGCSSRSRDLNQEQLGVSYRKLHVNSSSSSVGDK